jgi:hypothetical protein
MVSNKTMTIKDLPQAMLIASSNGDQHSTNHEAPHPFWFLQHWIPMTIDHNFPANNRRDRPESHHL